MRGPRGGEMLGQELTEAGSLSASEWKPLKVGPLSCPVHPPKLKQCLVHSRHSLSMGHGMVVSGMAKVSMIKQHKRHLHSQVKYIEWVCSEVLGTIDWLWLVGWLGHLFWVLEPEKQQGGVDRGWKEGWGLCSVSLLAASVLFFNYLCHPSGHFMGIHSSVCGGCYPSDGEKRHSPEGLCCQEQGSPLSRRLLLCPLRG